MQATTAASFQLREASHGGCDRGGKVEQLHECLPTGETLHDRDIFHQARHDSAGRSAVEPGKRHAVKLLIQLPAKVANNIEGDAAQQPGVAGACGSLDDDHGEQHCRRRDQRHQSMTTAGTRQHPLDEQRRSEAEQASQCGQCQSENNPRSMRRE